MPTKEDLERWQTLQRTGMCSCGNRMTDHAKTTSEIKDTPFHCALTEMEVLAWHRPPG